MSKSTLLQNKKSAIEVSLIHLLEIVLAIAIVLLLIYLGLKLSGLFLGKQEYESTVNNLEALYVRVKDLAAEKKDVAKQTMIYHIPENYILVGFNYDDKGMMKALCTNEDISKSRPQLCQAKSCLCVYRNYGGPTDWKGYDFDSKGYVTPIKCKTFDEKIVFLTPSSNQDTNIRGSQTQWKISSNPSVSYSYLVLYGQCGQGNIWGVRQIYLEKYKEGDNIFISISDLSNKKIEDENSYLRI